ncbi:hypothetical protein TELCIR_16326 [Teladorsagia circumcincta]|uniref:Uncharacterized protein n=1 Tax=Teladorsagia circumcincta TaxID=45464 RepID=A0A2G9TVS8_TELCI|nr:hypothetical protein TELCIR_16326 [Teladorsagia circumcincta]
MKFFSYNVCFQNSSHFLGAETPNLLRMKCHFDFYEKLKSTVIKTEAVGGQAMSADSSVAVIPQSECLNEVTVFESFCNVNCVAAYANIFIPTFSNTFVFSGPIAASTTKSSSSLPPKAYDPSRNYRRTISHHSQKFGEISTPSTSRAHYWDADIEVVSDMESYSSAAACFSEDRRTKRKRVGDLESSSDDALVAKITTRKSAKLELNAHSSSSESISDDGGEISNMRRHCISPSLVGGKYHFPLQSAQSSRDRNLKAHSKVVTIELSSDEDVVDEEEPLPIPESQLASESRKLIKSMESSMSKPRGRTAHPIKPIGTPVSSLDKDAIQRAQAIIDAWRSSSYEVVPDEVDLSSIDCKAVPQRSRRSLYSSADSLTISTDDAGRSESTHVKMSRPRTQRRTRTPKETNKKDSTLETTVGSSSPHQGHDIFVSPKSTRNRVSGEDKTVSLRGTSAHKKAEIRQQTRSSEPSAQLLSSETQDDSQISKPRIRKSKKVEESVMKPDLSRSSKSGEKIPHLEAHHIHVSSSHSTPTDQVVQKPESLSTSQRGPTATSVPSSEAEVASRTHGSRRGRPRKLAAPVETKELASALPLGSVPPCSSEEPVSSSPEQAVRRSSEAQENRSKMTPPRSLSPSETQDHPQIRKPRGRKPKKLTKSEETNVLDSKRPLRTGGHIPLEKVDPICTSKSRTPSPERALQKSSRARSGNQRTPSSSQPSLETQDDTQKRRAMESDPPSRFHSEVKAGKTSRHREQSKSSQATSRDTVESKSSLESGSRSQNVKHKVPTQLRDTNDATQSSSGPEKDSENPKREAKRISFEDQMFPERFKHGGSSKTKAKRAPAGRDDESKATRLLRSSSQSSGGDDVSETETSARGRPRYRAGKPFGQRTQSEEKGTLPSKKTVETNSSGDDYVGRLLGSSDPHPDDSSLWWFLK